MNKMRAFAEKIWSKMPESMSTERSNIFRRWRITRSKKLIILSSVLTKLPLPARHTIIAYPKPEHMDAFEDASRALKQDGPSKYFPGSVGSAKLNKNIFRKWLTLSYIQAHYETSSFAVNRSFASAYAGWRVRVLEHAIRMAHEKGYTLNIPTKTRKMAKLFDRKYQNYPPQIVKDLGQACENLGVTLEKVGNSYRISPK